ncbi:MAG: heat shock protein HspQ [Thermoanaerobaculia bacterium]|nr:heat shock protein HspQ [Thermoanaerobaculia bacterium]
MQEAEAKFGIGQLVHHLLFEYRGVIFEVDPVFRGTEEWYERVAKTRPPKDRPWYHVLVHGAGHTTYVAERNLEPDEERAPIRHPLVDRYFEGFDDGRYSSRQRAH